MILTHANVHTLVVYWDPVQGDIRALAVSDATDLTARIQFSAVCGQRLKYALLLAENHHHLAGLGPPNPIKQLCTLECLKLYRHHSVMHNQTVPPV